MRIINKTRWNTTDLRALTVAVAHNELDPYQRRGLVVEFRPGRRPSWISGRCYIGIVKGRFTAKLNRGGRFLHIVLPSKPPEPRQLAYVLAHEMAHARGLTHSVMKGGVYWYAQLSSYYDYAVPFTIGPEKVPVVDKLASKQKALDHARQMVKRWETRCKRDQTFLKAWHRREARLRRALDVSLLAVAASPEPPVAID